MIFGTSEAQAKNRPATIAKYGKHLWQVLLDGYHEAWTLGRLPNGDAEVLIELAAEANPYTAPRKTINRITLSVGSKIVEPVKRKAKKRKIAIGAIA